jgi:hypothetical protein
VAKSKAELQTEKLQMKAMVATKELSDITEDDLSLINKHSRRELKAEEVYVYPIILCDNEGDRDYEYFTKKDLEMLAPLFIGKTFIQDHAWKSGNQHSRIYKTEVIDAPGKAIQSKTKLHGQQYSQLKGWAYTIRKGHEDLIENIEAGILKEVSVGFSVKDLECDICGNSFFDYDNCKHWPGKSYKVNGQEYTCYLHMKEPREAYEVSFVAVPAQPAAGVTKGVKLEKEEREKENLENLKHEKSTSKKEQPRIFYAQISKRGEETMKYLKQLIEKAKAENAAEISIPVADLEKDLGTFEEAITKTVDAENAQKEAEDKLKELEPKVKMGEQYVEDLKKECLRLGKMADGEAFNADMMEKVFEKCSVEELKEFKNQYEKKLDEKYPPQPQIKSHGQKEKEENEDCSAYKVKK